MEHNEQRRWETDMTAINEIAGSLAKAQSEMSNPTFDAQNPNFRNRYASLAAVRNATIPVLAKYGISLSQDVRTVEGAIACETILTHASGQQMRFGPLVLPLSKSDAQGIGSAITYARRYQLMAVAAVVGDDDDDDDAEGAVGRAVEVEKKVSAEQVQRLQAIVDETETDLKRFCAYFKIQTLAGLGAGRFEEAVKALEAKRQRVAA